MNNLTKKFNEAKSLFSALLMPGGGDGGRRMSEYKQTKTFTDITVNFDKSQSPNKVETHILPPNVV